jgi:cap1 methyltransferase
VDVEEEVFWIDPPKANTGFLLEEMLEWRVIGTLQEKKVDAGKVFKNFVDPKVAEELMKCKKLFTEWDESFYQGVRARSNLFERVGKGPFICRAAMKMANLDALLGWELTEPKSSGPNARHHHNDLFYFADVCAGPGGFTE